MIDGKSIDRQLVVCQKLFPWSKLGHRQSCFTGGDVRIFGWMKVEPIEPNVATVRTRKHGMTTDSQQAMGPTG